MEAPRKPSPSPAASRCCSSAARCSRGGGKNERGAHSWLRRPRRPPSSSAQGAPDERLVLVTRLDGTVITSSVPRHVTNAAGFVDGKWTEEGAVSPWINFVEWLARMATRGTYWLLFLLLLSLLAFEFARRRARRKRRVMR